MAKVVYSFLSGGHNIALGFLAVGVAALVYASAQVLKHLCMVVHGVVWSLGGTA